MPFPFLKDPVPPVPANNAAVIKGDTYRFTVLTEWLIRLEYDPEGLFEDRPTKIVVNRDFSQGASPEIPPPFVLTEHGDRLQIRTAYFELHYRKKGPFSPYSLSIDKTGRFSAHDNTWHFGDTPETLKGTCRTLDKADGAVPLEEGLCAKIGYAILDDSASPVITGDGWVEKRRPGVVDMYYFGYGHNYRACIRDFYRLSGAPPLLPRFALGNWWSRYYAYTQDEYIALMTRFAGEDLPFSVAVIDMDWHITRVEEKYGRGWTGYTWNEELFPDHWNFLRWLREHKLKTSLNLHPADGVKAFEKMYKPMAKALGVDTDKEDPIPFDITSREFLAAYFEYLHYPLEDEGVDFWWLDWQSGITGGAEGFDSLWMLNHYHSLLSGRKGRRPLIFSRYAGPGSHRYPVGFSGDTYITWASLEFQPYFTAAAANIGYTFWSHDIGGHMRGYKDEELMIRWLQFGVFSPINRLHSSNSPFTHKEPWYYGPVVEKAMGIFLRLRHELVPYLYTMSRRCAAELEPLIQPLYYSHPEAPEAYSNRNQYWLGSELMVAAITQKTGPAARRAPANVWLPEGTWTDLFSGLVYRGGKSIRVWRTLSEYPVFARAGAIVPLASRRARDNGLENPEALRILVFPGGSNRFTLYEDSGDGEDYKTGAYAETEIEVLRTGGAQAEGGLCLSVKPRGDLSALPAKRSFTILFRGIRPPRGGKPGAAGFTVKVRAGNPGASASEEADASLEAAASYNEENNTLEIALPPLNRDRSFTLELGEAAAAGADYRLAERLRGILTEMQIPFDLKDAIDRTVAQAPSALDLVSSLSALVADQEVLGALLEMIYA